jgi:hypothetical protein
VPTVQIPEQAQDFIGLNTAPRMERAVKGDNNSALSQAHDEAGQPLWEVRVVSVPDAQPGRDQVPMPEITRITVRGAEPKIVRYAPVRFEGLVLSTWAAKDGRMGVMMDAQRVANGARPHGPGEAK